MQADWFGRKRFVVSAPAVVHACSLTRKVESQISGSARQKGLEG
jgi:hypothetical protein